MKTFCLIFLYVTPYFFIVDCSAQNHLPFYEQNSIGEYYLLRSDSIPDLKQSNQVSIISKHGIVGSGKFINLHITTEKECCTHPDPFFLMGTLKLNCKPDSIYYLVAGVINEGKLFNTKFDSVPDEKNFVTGDFNKTILDINYDPVYSYRWTKQFDGKYYLEVKDDANYFGTHPDNIIYPVDLKNCNYSKNDSIEILYCMADSLNENFHYEPRWILIYLNGKLLDARRDYSLTSSDGYGPFFYQLKFPAGCYKTENDFYILYNPGFVLHQQNGTWTEESREPCLYYGECDCGE